MGLCSSSWVFSLIIDLEASWQREELRVWIGSSDLSDGERLLSEKWTGANGQQINSELVRVPVFAYVGERLVIAHRPRLRGGRFSPSDRIDAGEVPFS
jgi:hypothetical protein